jgi:hypothetical protein
LTGEIKPYDKENPFHEAMLMDLWNTLFPTTKLETRVSEQWKKLGFQVSTFFHLFLLWSETHHCSKKGTDPATDFRGMGIIGLKHLLYFAKHHGDKLRTMMKAQEDNTETYFPVAVAGINISKLLYDYFKDSIEEQFSILFDHEWAYEEVPAHFFFFFICSQFFFFLVFFLQLYCSSLEFFDAIWKETGATYFQFNEVINSVNEQVASNLSECTKLEQFKAKNIEAIKEEKKEQQKDKKGKGKEGKKGFFKKFAFAGGSLAKKNEPSSSGGSKLKKKKKKKKQQTNGRGTQRTD